MGPVATNLCYFSMPAVMLLQSCCIGAPAAVVVAAAVAITPVQ
jgi:hypothetical protein